MCFASSVVDFHKNLCTANTGAQSDSGDHRCLCISIKSLDKPDSVSHIAVTNCLKNTNMSRNKSRLQAEVCGDCGASGKY